jgi:AcrR family transcriptional regulator
MNPKDKIRIPKQTRGINMKNKIIDAALTLFSQKGYNNTNSNEIAAKARVSIGSFYSYFKDKKHLFVEVMEYYSSQMANAYETAGIDGTKSKEDYISGLISNVMSAHKFKPGFHKELTIMELQDPDIKKIMDGRKKIIIESTRHQLESWKDQIKIDNLETGAFLIYNVIDKMIHEKVFSGAPVNEEELIKELTDMVLKYLFT